MNDFNYWKVRYLRDSSTFNLFILDCRGSQFKPLTNEVTTDSFLFLNVIYSYSFYYYYYYSYYYSSLQVS